MAWNVVGTIFETPFGVPHVPLYFDKVDKKDAKSIFDNLG